jgi:hypothetical protein
MPILHLPGEATSCDDLYASVTGHPLLTLSTLRHPIVVYKKPSLHPKRVLTI